MGVIEHPGIEDRRERGSRSRDCSPVGSHARWRPATDRPDPIALLDEFDRAIADVSRRSADQNEQDYAAFADAIRSGRLEAVEGE